MYCNYFLFNNDYYYKILIHYISFEFFRKYYIIKFNNLTINTLTYVQTGGTINEIIIFWYWNY